MVLPVPRARPAERIATAAAEERVEQTAEAALAEHVAEVGAACRRSDTGLAIPVVARPSIGVTEHLVCLRNLLEPLLGDGIARVGIGMQLPGLLAVGLLDLIGTGRA